MENVGFTIQLIGEILVAFMVLRVHHRVMREHKLDKKVMTIMKREQIVGYLGVIFLILGYLMQISTI